MTQRIEDELEDCLSSENDAIALECYLTGYTRSENLEWEYGEKVLI